jgi:hypothetical protein
LAHPTGSPAGIELADAPRRPWIAVHLLFVRDSLEAVLANGRDHKVHLPGNMLRVPLRSPAAPSTAWLELRHASELDLRLETSGDLAWRSQMIGAPGEVRRLLDAEIEILSVDVSSASAIGELEDCDEMPVKLVFSDDAFLFDPPSIERLTVVEFLQRLQPGDRIVVDGLLDDDRVVEVFAALIDERAADQGRGNKNKVEGSIVELLPESRAFRLRLMRVKKAGAGFPSPTPRELTIGAGDAKIKHLPRRGRHRGHLAYDSLDKGMFVEVEWHGAVVDGRVAAHKINIKGEDDRRSPVLVELEGRVREVDGDRKLLVLTPTTGDAFRIGERSHPTAVVEIGPESVIVQKVDGRYRIIDLGDVAVGRRATVLGRHLVENRIQALLVRIGGVD